MTRPYFNKDGTVCEDRLLRSGETVRIIHQCRSVGRPNKNKSLQNEMYRKLVKGEYEKKCIGPLYIPRSGQVLSSRFYALAFRGHSEGFLEACVDTIKEGKQFNIFLKSRGRKTVCSL